MTDEEIDALARELLIQTIKDVHSWNAHYFHDILEMEDGELIPVFAATSPDGFGSFLCEFYALATIKKLIAGLEKDFDEFVRSMANKPLSDAVKQRIHERLIE